MCVSVRALTERNDILIRIVFLSSIVIAGKQCLVEHLFLVEFESRIIQDDGDAKTRITKPRHRTNRPLLSSLIFHPPHTLTHPPTVFLLFFENHHSDDVLLMSVYFFSTPCLTETGACFFFSVPFNGNIT